MIEVHDTNLVYEQIVLHNEERVIIMDGNYSNLLFTSVMSE